MSVVMRARLQARTAVVSLGSTEEPRAHSIHVIVEEWFADVIEPKW
jgi:hypothetical protein